MFSCQIVKLYLSIPTTYLFKRTRLLVLNNFIICILRLCYPGHSPSLSTIVSLPLSSWTGTLTNGASNGLRNVNHPSLNHHGSRVVRLVYQ